MKKHSKLIFASQVVGAATLVAAGLVWTTGSAKAQQKAPSAITPENVSARPTTGPTVSSSPEIEHLLDQLNSDSWKLRDVAQEQLTQLAEAAEPRLKQFLATTDNAEARARAQAAMLHIISIRRVGPTLVSLHLKDAAPAAAFAELARQIHLPIAPLRDSIWQQSDNSAITVDLDRVPFWAAMRQVCLRFGVRALFTGGADEGAKIVLTRDATGEMSSPASYNGSFMVVATSVSRKKGLFGAAAAANQPEESPLSVEVTFFADPKWQIIEHPDQAIIDRVEDDNGKQLPKPEPLHMQAFKPESPIWLMRTDIAHVPPSCQRLSVLHGNFRIKLLEQSEPLEVANVLAVHNVVKKVSNQSIQIRETIKEAEFYKVKLTVFRNGLSAQDWRQQREAQGVALIDRQGRSLIHSGFTAEEHGDQVDYELTYVRAGQAAAGTSADEQAEPARMIISIPLEPNDITIPFQFRDLAVE